MAPARHEKRPRSNTATRPLPGLFHQKFANYRHSTGTILEDHPDVMPLFSRTIPALKLSAHPTRDDQINAFLSSDVHADLELEDSFASNMSLNSPPKTHRRVGLPDSPDDDPDYVPMDISPAPPRVFYPPPKQQQANQPYYRARTDRERDTNHTMQLPLPAANAAKTSGRPRSNTASNARLFGTDVSNANAAGKKADEKGSDKEKSTAGRKLQRAALPFEWTAPSQEVGISTSVQSVDIPSSPDAMDIDMSFGSQSSSAPEAPAPISAAATITQFRHIQDDDEPASAAPTVTQFENYFYRSSSPIDAPDFHEDASTSMAAFEEPVPRKKRSVSPEAPQKRRSHTQRTVQLLDESTDLESSPAQMESPSVHKLERLNSKPALRGLPLPAFNGNNKRLRRPVLSAMVAPGGDVESMLRSAHPVLETSNEETLKFSAAAPVPAAPPKNKENEPRPRGAHILPPVRRAFSAMIPQTVNPMEQSFSEGEDNSFSMDAEHDMSSPAQAYARRQQVKTIRRRDGTDDFRSVTGATALLMRDGEMRGAAAVPGSGRKEREERGKSVVAERDTPRSKYLTGGGKIGNFGDLEHKGKILPCRRVPEDGLMRITCETLDSLLDGAYDNQIAQFIIIDCRFDYEYNGGHIPGAININTITGVEDFLLGPRVSKPEPSLSCDPARKTILVFHCEFSQKRAPTFAKHLRSKDRTLNHEVYPRVHYPEVYILEGGYCQYFQQSGPRCQPPKYVRMDDPNYAHSRREDLDQFRKGKFGRTKSYAYGEGKPGLLLSSQPAAGQPKRNSAPTNGVTTLFAAGNAARTRRTQGMLQTLQEDSSGAVATDCEDEDTDIGDSPCPPPTKGVVFKGGKMPRMALARAETYGPSTSKFMH